MASDAFPPTLVCSWSSVNPVEDVNGLISRLELLSTTHTLPWEIFITLKFRNQKKKKQLGSLLTSSSVRNIVNYNNRTDEKETADVVSALYFVRYNDIELCCVIRKRTTTLPTGTSGIEIIPLCDGCEEKWLTKAFPRSNSSSSGSHASGTTADTWTTRTIWRASGQKFCFGAYIISVGFLEHTGAAARPVLEVSYCPVSAEAFTTTQQQAAGAAHPCIQSKLQKVAADLLYAVHPDTVQISPFAGGKFFGSNSNSSTTGELAGSATTVEARSLQWVSIL